MGLRDSATIDIIIDRPAFETEPCKLILMIIDATSDLDDATRLSMLINKLAAYLAYVGSPQLPASHPGVKPEDVIVRVLTVMPPTAAMLKIDAVKSPDKSIRLPVFFSDYHQYMYLLKAGNRTPPSPN